MEWFCKGKELIFRTIKDVEHFENLRSTYIPRLFETTEQRRKHLFKSHYFHCCCENCQNEESDRFKKSSMSCPKCNECVPVMPRFSGKHEISPLTTTSCNNCNYQMEGIKIEKFSELKSKISNNLLNETGFEEFEALFERSVSIFHPYDIDFMSLLNILWDRYNQEGNSRKGLTVGLLMLKNYEKNLPKNCLDRVNLELSIAQICNALSLFQEANKHVDKAEDILIVSRGKDHPLITDVCTWIREQINLNCI